MGQLNSGASLRGCWHLPFARSPSARCSRQPPFPSRPTLASHLAELRQSATHSGLTRHARIQCSAVPRIRPLHSGPSDPPCVAWQQLTPDPGCCHATPPTIAPSLPLLDDPPLRHPSRASAVAPSDIVRPKGRACVGSPRTPPAQARAAHSLSQTPHRAWQRASASSL